ncbi:MAG: hypothetical protein ACREOF_12945 [Gemmatimonadales bacterium]
MPMADKRARIGGEPPAEAPDVTAASVAPTAAPAVEPTTPDRAGRVHLVVVTTRDGRDSNPVSAGTTLVTRFWHPREHRWSENAFESLEHALHLFIEESGWTLRQQQAVEGPQAYELIFEARREDFSRPSADAMLEDIGLTRQDVADLMDRVARTTERR